MSGRHIQRELDYHQLKNVSLPDKLKCMTCNKLKISTQYSQKQLSQGRQQLCRRGLKSATSLTAVRIKCLACSDTQIHEITCTICGETKDLDGFAKAQRRQRGVARCLECVIMHERTDPGQYVPTQRDIEEDEALKEEEAWEDQTNFDGQSSVVTDYDYGYNNEDSSKQGEQSSLQNNPFMQRQAPARRAISQATSEELDRHFQRALDMTPAASNFLEFVENQSLPSGNEGLPTRNEFLTSQDPPSTQARKQGKTGASKSRLSEISMQREQSSRSYYGSVVNASTAAATSRLRPSTAQSVTTGHASSRFTPLIEVEDEDNSMPPTSTPSPAPRLLSQPSSALATAPISSPRAPKNTPVGTPWHAAGQRAGMTYMGFDNQGNAHEIFRAPSTATSVQDTNGSSYSVASQRPGVAGSTKEPRKEVAFNRFTVGTSGFTKIKGGTGVKAKAPESSNQLWGIGDVSAKGKETGYVSESSEDMGEWE
ncbi:MAG: hypothetical protein M1814_006555 [Vezdaea aestivalis]|nr:MAG: hypothetical protein M1814_006555 [Vezdaea aestivalis]